MKRTLSYKGYHGSIEFSLNDNILFGQVININSLISYEGTTLDELKKDFKNAIDEYLKMCKEHNETPEKAYTGTFTVRLNPEIHQKLALYANEHNESLSTCVKRAITQMLIR